MVVETGADTTPALQDLAAGQIDIFLAGAADLPLMRAGSIKAYAVTSERRLPAAPEIPTVGELGLPRLSEYTGWMGLFAPKGTPKDIINKLNAAVVDALADAATRSRLVDLGEEIIPDDQAKPGSSARAARGRYQEMVAAH
jgi:tripartite-type tricarboxylate transporter receptor subunit TctC